MKASDFLTDEERQEVVSAIQSAEKATSGEVRIHIENKCSGDPKEPALKAFHKLGMTATKARNGVLIYVAVESHKLAILGDKGINDVVPEGFWEDVIAVIKEQFAEGNFCAGLCKGLEMVGEKLKAYFPYQSDDVNELSDEISFEDEK